MRSLASRPALRVLALVALIVLPLAVVGLFAGALSQVGSPDGRIPAAIVNQDEFVEQTAEDGTVTIRDRDSLAQERVAVSQVGAYLGDALRRPWKTPKRD